MCACDCRLIYFQALSAIFIIIMIISLARLVFVVVFSPSRSLDLSFSRAQFSRSRRKLFNAEMGNVMKKFLFFLSLWRGVLRVARWEREGGGGGTRRKRRHLFPTFCFASFVLPFSLSLPLTSAFFCRLCCH